MSVEAIESDKGNALRAMVAFWNKAGIFVMLIIACAIMAALKGGTFLQAANLMNVVRQVSIIGVIAVGMTMVILLGLIDLSVGSTVAMTGILCAACQVWWFKGENEYYMLAVSVGIALSAGAVAGFFNGFVSTKGRIHPFIITLGTMLMFRGFTLFIGNGRPITGMTTTFRYIGAGELWREPISDFVHSIGFPNQSFGIPVPVIIFLAAVAIAAFVLKKTAFGRSIYAIGGNQEASYLSGIMVDRVKIATFTILGALCGLSAVILTSRLNSGEMVAGQGYELEVITAVIIGGTSMMGGEGSVWGTLAGALLIGVIQNGMNLMMVQPYWQSVVKGAIIIIAVLMDRLKQVFQRT